MIVVDVETTGLDERKHSIVSIGAVEFENPSNQFSIDCRIWDGAEIQEGALKVNGFTEEQIRDPSRPSLKEAISKFIAWSKGCKEWTLAGENPRFDSNFLKATLDKYNEDIPNASGEQRIDWPFGHRTVDVHTLCYASYLRRGLVPPVAKNRTAISLDDAAVYVGLQPESKPHVASTGAVLEAEVLHRLLHGKHMFDKFKHFPVPDYLR